MVADSDGGRGAQNMLDMVSRIALVPTNENQQQSDSQIFIYNQLSLFCDIKVMLQQLKLRIFEGN